MTFGEKIFDKLINAHFYPTNPISLLFQIFITSYFVFSCHDLNCFTSFRLFLWFDLKCFAIFSAFNDLRRKLKSFTSRAFSWTVERGDEQLSPFDDVIGWSFWKDNWPICYRVGKLLKTVRSKDSKCQYKVLWFPSKCLYMHQKYNLSNLSIFVMENKKRNKT
jgi:hypothetical protein